MRRPAARHALCTVVAILAPLEMSEALGDAPPAGVEDHHWTLRTGAEAGAQDSRATTASVDYAGSTTGEAAPSFGVSGLHSDAPDSSGDTVTTAGRAVVQYGTAALKGSVAFDGTSDQNLRHSERWTAMFDFGANGWDAQLNVSTRTTHFDGFNVATEEARRINLGTALSTTARCSLRDTGYGGTVTYNSDHWTAYVSATGNSYDSIDCAYDVTVPAALKRLDAADFQHLAGRFLDRAAARAGGWIGQDSRLLASLIGTGVAHHWNRFSLALDYTRSKDELGGAIQNGYALTGTMSLNSTLAFDVVAGVTTGSAASTTSDSSTAPYAGAYVTVTL